MIFGPNVGSDYNVLLWPPVIVVLVMLRAYPTNYSFDKTDYMCFFGPST